MSPATMRWQQLSFVTSYADFAEEILTARGAVSVSLLPPDHAEAVLEPGPGETPLWHSVRVQALFDRDADTGPAQEALRTTLPDGAALEIIETTVADQDWLGQVRDAMQAMRFGRRLWVCPQHREVNDPDAVIVRLDPGLAFGTGTHPTTALCLRWLDAQLEPGMRVLDYGCGSGVLAVAAARLGAARVTAVDIDPQALRATAENARINAVADRIDIVAAKDFAPQPFDVVLANILATPLIELAPTLHACVRPDGALVLAGLLARQADAVRAAYPGFALEGDTDEGWTRLSGNRAEKKTA